MKTDIESKRWWKRQLMRSSGPWLRPKRYRTEESSVQIPIKDLALLCLAVDYRLGRDSEARDRVEEISVQLQQKHGFDTHLFRLAQGERFTEGSGFDDE